MSVSCIVIVSAGWFLTDRVIEPRLRRVPVDGNSGDTFHLGKLSGPEQRGLLWSIAAMIVALLGLWLAVAPAASPFRSKTGSLSDHGAPLMESIVPLIFLLFLVPGIVYGVVAGTVKTHRDVIKGMSRSMETMGYYLVMAFAAAQFTFIFRESNLGALIAIKGANLLESLHMPAQVTIVGIIILSTLVNLLIGSASAKWALLGPIFVPMLMQVGLSPELTQAAYRIGDSSTNIITPLLPYFPLIVVYCRRYSGQTGIGTVVSMMLPYSMTFLVSWTLLLLAYWATGLPLGLQAGYTYP
jgi:aminobenzoyl-glutamate transport protein